MLVLREYCMTQSTDYTYPHDRIRPNKWLMLTYIQEFRRSHHRYPTIREIAESFGIPTPHVYLHLKGWSLFWCLKAKEVNRVR